MRINMSVPFSRPMELKLSDGLLLVLTLLFSIPVVQAASEADNISSEHNSIPPLSAENLLQRFVDNGPRQLFDGTFVYFFEDKVQTITVHRTIDDKGQVVEQFVPMDGKQKKNTRILKNQFCALNNNWPYQFQAMSSSFPFRVNNYYRQLEKNYTFRLTGMQTVAGLPAAGLTISSKDSYRYSYQLWFEPQTATLLKYILVDHLGKPVEQYLFTNINIHNNTSPQKSADSIQQIPSCTSRFKGLTEAFQEYFERNKIPAGYEPVSFRKGYIHGSKRQAFQFQLSDGLSTVSVFVEDSKPANKVINGVVKLGPVNVVGKTIGRHQVTVIGAIPISSAAHFLEAIKVTDAVQKNGVAAHD